MTSPADKLRAARDLISEREEQRLDDKMAAKLIRCPECGRTCAGVRGYSDHCWAKHPTIELAEKEG